MTKKNVHFERKQKFRINYLVALNYVFPNHLFVKAMAFFFSSLERETHLDMVQEHDFLKDRGIEINSRSIVAKKKLNTYTGYLTNSFVWTGTCLTTS